MERKLKIDFGKALNPEEMMKIKGGEDCWVCTETWQGWDPVVRNCCGDYLQCNTCIMTGPGCNVACIAP